jgi:hypothetical protein
MKRLRKLSRDKRSRQELHAVALLDAMRGYCGLVHEDEVRGAIRVVGRLSRTQFESALTILKRQGHLTEVMIENERGICLRKDIGDPSGANSRGTV